MARLPQTRPKTNTWRHDFLMNKWLYLMAVPVCAYFAIFSYVPR